MPRLFKSELAVMLVFFACAVAVLCLAASQGVTDTFVYSNTALAETTIQDGHLTLHPYSNVGNSVQRHANGQSMRYLTTSIISELSVVSGIPAGELPFVPVCGLMLFFMAYAFARSMFQNQVLAGTAAFFVSVEPVVLSLSYSVYLQGWAYVMLFAFMAAFLKLIGSDDVRGARWKYLAVCSAMLVGIYFTYYSALAYAIIFAGMMVALSLLFGSLRARFGKKSVFILIALAAASLAGFVAVDPAAGGFVNGLAAKFGVAGDLAADYVARLLGNGGGTSGGVVSGGAIPGIIVLAVGMAIYALLFLPILALFLQQVRLRKIWSPLCAAKNQAFIALLTVIAMDLTIYMMVGTVSYKMVLLFGPFASIYAFTKLKLSFKWPVVHQFDRKKAAAIFVGLLLIMVVVKTGVNLETAPDKRMSASSQSSEWLIDIGDPDTRTLSDMLTAERIFMYQSYLGIRNGESTVFNSYTLPFFYEYNESLADSELTKHEIEYVVINWGNIDGGVGGTDWLGGGGFGDVEAAFGQYPFLDLVYVDGYCLIYEYNSGFGVPSPP